MDSADAKGGDAGEAAEGAAPARWRKDLLDRYKEQLADFTLLDDRFMMVCLKGQSDCLQHIVRIVLGDGGVRIVGVRDQEVLPQVLGHTVQLEFLCEAADGRRFVVEFESTSRRFPVRRARFYASMADAASLRAGQEYGQLPDVVVIVFCPADPFGDGLRTHTFRRTADETGSPMGDGSVIIYVSCKDPDGTPLGELTHDLTCANPDKMHSPLLADRVRAVKERKVNVNALEEMYQIAVQDGRERGLEQGLEQGRINAFLSMVSKGLIGADVAARELGMDEHYVAEQAGSYIAERKGDLHRETGVAAS